jgi:hypothetical protein
MATNFGATAISSAASVSIVSSMFVSTGPVTLAETAPSGSMSVFNNLFNFPAVLSISLAGRIEMWHNTVNRTQFRIDGNSTGVLSIHNNYFANPPVHSNVSETGTPRYVVAIKPASIHMSGSSAADNVRYSTWDGFENVSTVPLFGAGNTAIAPAKDSNVAWDWRIPGDTAHGAWTGNIPLPIFNLYPPDSSLDLPILGGRAIVAPGPFPRRVRFTLKTVPLPYSAVLPDSVRSFFRSDTLLAMEGSAAVVSLTLPSRDDGVPLLFGHADAGFLPGPAGTRGGTLYRNAHPEAREFLPALGGQNTFRGTNIATPDPLLPGLSLVFSSVTRPGVTAFGASQLKPVERKWRKPLFQGREVSFTATSNAEAAGTIRIGIPDTGISVFRKDSLFFWQGADRLLPVKDSAGRYWAAVPAPLGKLEAMLIERMTFGPGSDSLILPQARIVAKSAAGHQLAFDSARISVQDEPYMGDFGAALKLSWPGRAAGDSLFAQFPRNDPQQQVWIRKGGASSPYPLLSSDARSLRVALAPGDSNQVFYVARKFSIPGGRTVSLAFGADSILNLFSSRPGELSLDAGFRPTDLDTTRLRILAARRIQVDSLVPQGLYTLSLTAGTPKQKDLVRALVNVNAVWTATAFAESGGRYAISVPSAARAAMVVEFQSAADWAPAQPAAAAAMALRGDSLVLSPRLTSAERSALPSFRVDLASLGPSGNPRLEPSRYAPVESSLSVGLAPDRLYAYRVVYRSPLDRFSPDLGWIPLSGKQPSLADLESRIPVRKGMFRHLIGFPFAGATVGTNVKAGMEGGSGDILALDSLAGGQWTGLSRSDQTPLERGKGYLVGTDRPFRLKAQGALFQGLKADTLRFDRVGWHLIANPLPYPFPRSALGIPDSTALSFPRSLHRQDTAAGSPAVYDWPIPDTLQPFEGYLLYVFKPTYLAFDPFARLPAGASGAAPKATAAKASAAANTPGAGATDALRLTLTGPHGSQSAVFYRSGPFLQTPYMRPFTEGVRTMEFRAGDGGGWAFRKVDRTDSLRIPLEIVAPEAGTYALSVSAGSGDATPGLPGAGGGKEALLDLQSGKVYGAGEMGSLPLSQGPHAFALLQGKAVDPGIADFANGLPADFTLDQNFPNPFRARTRIRFRVPGGLEGSLRGSLKVTSLDGRLVEARDLGALTVGEHTLTVGDAGWRPGVYVYELRLDSEKGAQTLRKKMICGPAGG